MAKVLRASINAEVEIVLSLSESEAKALDGIFGYNVEAFLKVFYDRMGKAYVQPHEDGVRSLHKTIRSALSGPLAKVSTARMALDQALREVGS